MALIDPDEPLFLEYSDEFDYLTEESPCAAEGIGDRMFIIQDGCKGSRHVFAVVLAEIKDSFMVVFPMTLNSSDGVHVTGKLISAAPVMRLFKSSIIGVSDIDHAHRPLYFQSLIKLVKLLPTVFPPDKVELILKVVNDEEIEEEEPEDEPAKPSDPENTFRTSFVSNLRH